MRHIDFRFSIGDFRLAAIVWLLLPLAVLVSWNPGFTRAGATDSGTPTSSAAAKGLQTPFWQVDEVRPGMKGHGCSVFKGSKVERFDVEVLGVLKNTSPGRDLIVVRTSGCNLETSGVIAGMSGSPVYVDGKLLGAIAYAWAFGKEPIAGVTPFAQMVEYVESYERRDLAKKLEPLRVRLDRPIRLGDAAYDSVTVTHDRSAAVSAAGQADDALWLQPLQMPLIAGGFTQHSLNLLRERASGAGWSNLMPVQAGSAAAHLLKQENETPLEPGSPLAVALITGDFDLSGIGTVTHVEGERVWGWGHPFLSVGACELPLMSGYIHTIYPRQSISFKMGSPIRTLGVINADVSTGIAGWLGRKPDMMPLSITLRRDGVTRTFQCETVRQKALMPQLVYTALTNSVDMEGELPEELTAQLEARIEFEDRPPLVIEDTYSGPSYAGGRAPGALYSQIAAIVHTLNHNTFKPVRIKRIECNTVLLPGRRNAEIDSVRLDSETYSPGETLKATVFLKPYKGLMQRVPVQLQLPKDLPEGVYTAQIMDDVSNARSEIRESPTLSFPNSLDQVFEALKLQAAAKRTHLVVRVPVSDAGVAIEGQELPHLPGSMIEMLSNTRRTGVMAMKNALVARHETEWVVLGAQSAKFTVAKNKRLSTD